MDWLRESLRARACCMRHVQRLIACGPVYEASESSGVSRPRAASGDYLSAASFYSTRAGPEPPVESDRRYKQKAAAYLASQEVVFEAPTLVSI